MVTSGLACLLMGAMYYVVDILKYNSGTKSGVIFGSNAIAIYFISDVISNIFYTIPFGALALSDHFMAGMTTIGLAPKFVSMLYAILFVFINFIIAYILYRRKIFIKL
jgi:predicted acyltransferase